MHTQLWLAIFPNTNLKLCDDSKSGVHLTLWPVYREKDTLPKKGRGGSSFNVTKLTPFLEPYT